MDYYAFQGLKTNIFVDSASINNVLFAGNPITDSNVVDAIWTDPYYGINNPANYVRWAVLAGSHPNAKNVFQVEMASYFALTAEQIELMTTNWVSNYYTQQSLVIATIAPVSGTAYQNNLGAAYWQWANAYLTM